MDNLNRTALRQMLNEEKFEATFHGAEIANFTPEQMAQYEESLKVYRDLKGVIDTSYEDGKNKRNIEIALKMKKKRVPVEKISAYTDLSIEEINRLTPGE